MRILFDTHLLLWAALDRALLPPSTAVLMADPKNQLLFSNASVWEVAIKFSRKRPDFLLHPSRFRDGLLERGYTEIAITSEHILATADLPPIHRDPFDRLLVAQAIVEDVILLTIDSTVLLYPGPVQQG